MKKLFNLDTNSTAIETGKKYIHQLYFDNVNEYYNATTKLVGNKYLVKLKDTDSTIEVSETDLCKNKYHSETLSDHVAFTIAMMEKKTQLILPLVIALFHDVGKLGTIRKQSDGQSCFDGHEELSANIFHNIFGEYEFSTYLSGCTTFNNYFKIADAVIRHHEQLKLLEGTTKMCFKFGFEECYGHRALKYLEYLDSCDRGLSEEELCDQEVVMKIKRGYAIAAYLKNHQDEFFEE